MKNTVNESQVLSTVKLVEMIKDLFYFISQHQSNTKTSLEVGAWHGRSKASKILSTLLYLLSLFYLTKCLLFLKVHVIFSPIHSFVITSHLIKESVSYFISFVDNLFSLHYRPNIFAYSQLV